MSSWNRRALDVPPLNPEWPTAGIGRDLQRKGAYAVAGALAGITAHLALRFRPSFAATIAAVLPLYLFGGTALRGFSVTLLVGIAVGTWSSVFVAAPVAALLARRGQR